MLHSSIPTWDLRTDGGGEAEDFIERSLDQASKQGAKKRGRTAGEVLTTRREALSLYRAVWRASFLFVWRNEKGEEWRDIIRESARKEFEAARHERDPEISPGCSSPEETISTRRWRSSWKSGRKS